MEELELIAYWALLIGSLVLASIGSVSLAMARKRQGFSKSKIVKVTEVAEVAEAEMPALFASMEKLVPEEKVSPSSQTCEECGSYGELKPLTLAVQGSKTTRKMVCSGCLKRLTMRHVT